MTNKYALVIDAFSDRPIYWTGSILSYDVRDAGGFDLAAVERAARHYRHKVTAGGSWGLYPDTNGNMIDHGWNAKCTYNAIVIASVKADDHGNVLA